MTKHRKSKSKRQKGGYTGQELGQGQQTGLGQGQQPALGQDQQPGLVAQQQNNNYWGSWFQKNGIGNWFSTEGVGNWFSSAQSKAKKGLESANNAIGNAASYTGNAIKDAASETYEKAQSLISSPTTTHISSSSSAPISSSSSIQSNNYNGTGGKNKRRTRKKKCMKGGNNYLDNAAPVHGLKVAEPTYMINTKGPIKGGKKKHCRNRSKKNHK